MSFRFNFDEGEEGYIIRHYAQSFNLAVKIFQTMFPSAKEREDWIVQMFFDKIASPLVYLREDFSKLQKRNKVSGGPEKGPDTPSSQGSSSPRQVSFRKPTQTLTEKLRSHMTPELFAKIRIENGKVYKIKHLTDLEFRDLSGFLDREEGMRWISAGKDSRWEKQ